MSIVGYFTMAVDKKKAIQGKWRTPESQLFLIAFLLGGVGSTIAMFVKRHKTKHWYFKIGMPLLAVWSIAVLVLGCFFAA